MTKWTSHISIVLLVSISLTITWQSFTIVHFYANQEQIENEFCVNKDKPELNCHGKCHLEKLLSLFSNDYTESSVKMNSGILIFQAFASASSISVELNEKNKLFFSDFNQKLPIGDCANLLDPPEIIS